MKKRFAIAFLGIFAWSACSSTNTKFNETIGTGTDAVRVRYQKPQTELTLSKTAVVSCDSMCKNAVTQVYEFEHIETETDNASCKYKFSVPCYPLSCDQRNYACSTSCKTDDQCAARAVCDQESHQCVPVYDRAEPRTKSKVVEPVATPNSSPVTGIPAAPKEESDAKPAAAATPEAISIPAAATPVPAPVKPKPQYSVDSLNDVAIPPQSE